ncbi:hypothetical protein [Catellatospora sp. NPDC049609]|uniref:hypothetical protein n=1 Tax=Catellatospora sp. NPDC049609 TaxID=3155505 RepID=UPI00342D7051
MGKRRANARMVDFSRVLGLVDRNDFEGLRALCRSGWDANQQERWTGNSALLMACTKRRTKLVRLLLHHGADPNLQHFDGYNCYDSTSSGLIRRMLVAAGFRWQSQWFQNGNGYAAMRHLSVAEDVDRTVTFEIAGTDMRLEHQVHRYPPMAGAVEITASDGQKRVGFAIELTTPGHGGTAVGETEHPNLVTFTVMMIRFRGDVRVRAYCADTAAATRDPAFWVPPWTG